MTMQSQFDSSDISAAESTRHSWDEEANRLTREHDLAVRKLELDYMRLETRWNILLRLPLELVKLPVTAIMAIGYVVAMARGIEPTQSFWDYISK